jgi:hypothetical protein
MLFSSIAKVKFKLLSLDNKKKYMYMCLLVYGDWSFFLKWVIDCCLTPNEQPFSYIIEKTSNISAYIIEKTSNISAYIIEKTSNISMKWCLLSWFL